MGEQIKSNMGVAQGHAGALNNAAEMLLGYGDATKDGDTTITGNATTASDKIDKEMENCSKLAVAIQAFCNCIREFDGQFQDTDAGMAAQINQKGSEGWNSKNVKKHSKAVSSNGAFQTSSPLAIDKSKKKSSIFK